VSLFFLFNATPTTEIYTLSLHDALPIFSDQYESKVFNLKDGTNVLGRLMSEDEHNYVISQNPYAPQVTKTIAKNTVKSMNRSEVSIMPPGTLNVMSPDEVKDIMAYLMSGGNEKSEVYNKK